MFSGVSGIFGVSSLTVNGIAGAQANELEATFFVSTDGNDGWSGKLEAPNAEKTDGPFATIARARDAIREMKADGGLSGPVNVMVRGGTHFLEETIVFGPEDSGTEDCCITYMAYPGEKPVISGGRKITGPWKSYKGEIMLYRRGKSGKMVLPTAFRQRRETDTGALPG
ncbi:hypothetical protein ACFL6S_36590 [Candidatus Poribacteria bacterium]